MASARTDPQATNSQATNRVMLVRPVRFQSNEQTAASNSFQNHDAAPDPVAAQRAAIVEFERMVAVLVEAGVLVHVFDDAAEPHTPDSIFPNNWFSSHSDGSVFLYPMCAANRRPERRLDIIADLGDELGFSVSRLVDLSGYEDDRQYLEGTGSLVLDRANQIAYACSSARTHQAVLDRFSEITGYRIIGFSALDGGGSEIYHTNVLMCVGREFSVVCLDAIRVPEERAIVEQSLSQSGHEIIPISHEQMEAFAGNMLELRSSGGQPLIVMSQCAFDSLSDAQRDALTRHGRLLPVDIDTIESCAGGSVRCMIAELYLPLQ